MLSQLATPMPTMLLLVVGEGEDRMLAEMMVEMVEVARARSDLEVKVNSSLMN